MRLIVVLACAALAACAQQETADRRPTPSGQAKAVQPTPAVPQPGTSPAQPMPVAPTVGTLAGEWRVAGIDGKEFNEPYGLALRGSAQELWWEPRCAGVARSYRIEGTAVTFGPPLGAPPPGAMPAPVCAIGLPPRIDEVTRALDAATKIVRTAANGIEISGGSHSLLLFSQ